MLRPSAKTNGLRGTLVSCVLIQLTAAGCARTQPVTLKVPSSHPVIVAAVELDPGASKVTSIESPFNTGRYNERDLEVLQEMLDETVPFRGPPEESFRIHLVLRRVLIAYYRGEAVGLSCIAWALTSSRGDLVFDEQFYAAAHTGGKGVSAVKNRMHTGITMRVHHRAQEVASGLPYGQPPQFTYDDYESAAAAVPDALGVILVTTLGRGGATRGVEYVGETGEEFARCSDFVDWHSRLGIPMQQ